MVLPNFIVVGTPKSATASLSRYLADHPDEACPAKWTQGAKTLKPGPEMVGKVFEALQ